MIKKVFCGFFSNLMVKFWQSRKYFYLTMSPVTAASFQTKYLISKKCCEIGKTANLSWGMLPQCILIL